VYTHCNKNKYTETYDVSTYCIPVREIIMSCRTNHRCRAGDDSRSQTFQHCVAETEKIAMWNSAFFWTGGSLSGNIRLKVTIPSKNCWTQKTGVSSSAWCCYSDCWLFRFVTVHAFDRWTDVNSKSLPLVLLEVLVLDLSSPTSLRFGLGTFFGPDSVQV